MQRKNIIVAFTDITAGSFVGLQELENGQKVTGAGIATSSLLYLVLPIIMGLLLRYTRLSVGWATVIFLPLVGLAIWIGQQPGWGLDIAAMWQGANPELTPEAAQATARKTWDVLLLGYCLVASGGCRRGTGQNDMGIGATHAKRTHPGHALRLVHRWGPGRARQGNLQL